MNREIKFRVFDKGDRRMKYADIEYFDDMIGFRFEHRYFEQDDNSDIVLMQYTGLKDKNGKEIYEGDILREPAKDNWEEKNYSCFEVFFHDGDANSDYNIGYTMGRMHNHGSVCGGYIPSFKPKTVAKMIIIGNIYETPHLINSEPAAQESDTTNDK